MTDELGHIRHITNLPCFLGGTLHSARDLGTDVRHCVTRLIKVCVYCGRETSKRVPAPPSKSRCAQCNRGGDLVTLYTWDYKGEPRYICRDWAACVRRQKFWLRRLSGWLGRLLHRRG
jgi:hypothetical protein